MRFRSASWLLFCFVLVAAVPAMSKDNGVTSTLAAYKVTRAADGTDKKVAADKAEAGATVEYDLTYANNSKGPVKGLVATLPIPKGTAYVDGSSHPADIQASLDGTNFAAAPLLRDE